MFVYGGVVVYGAFSRFFSSSFSLCVYFLRFSRRFSDSAAARESFVPEPTAERAKIKENVPNEKKDSATTFSLNIHNYLSVEANKEK